MINRDMGVLVRAVGVAAEGGVMNRDGERACLPFFCIWRDTPYNPSEWQDSLSKRLLTEPLR